MKKLSITVLSLSAFTLGFVYISANTAYATVVPEVCYNFDAGAETITHYDTGNPACVSDPEIPSTIGGVPVTTIGNLTFSYNQLDSVTIPNSVTTIGYQAFGGNRLTSVTIPNSVTSIGEAAFYNNQLSSLTIPASVTTIAKNVFSDNYLTSLTIPGSVTSVGEQAFLGNRLTTLTIPSSVTSIGEAAFRGNNLTSLTIPNSVTTIEDDTFSYNHLTSLTIPNSVTSIGAEAFAINGLTSVTLPSSVVSVNHSAFWGQGLDDGGWSRLYGFNQAAQAQAAMDSIWYVRLYTEDSSNPHNIQDAIVTEADFGFDPDFDTNQDGSSDNSLGGYLVNPAQAVLHYKSASQQTLQTAQIFTGNGLTSYLATQNPTNDTSLYYRLNDSRTFSAPKIDGYTTPTEANLLLSSPTTDYNFLYNVITAAVDTEPVDSLSPIAAVTDTTSRLADTGENTAWLLGASVVMIGSSLYLLKRGDVTHT